MGEYVSCLGRKVKIGTCECLYYVSFQKYFFAYQKGWLQRIEGNLPPRDYMEPDSESLFRFPFPDEDKLPFGEIYGDYFRGIPVTIDSRVMSLPEMDPADQPAVFQIEIVQQRLVHRQEDGLLCLALVWRDSLRDRLFRTEDMETIRVIISQMIRHHIAPEQDAVQKDFYRQIAARILKGYRLPIIKDIQQIHQKTAPRLNPGNDRSKGLR